MSDLLARLTLRHYGAWVSRRLKKARQLCIPQAYGNWHQLLEKEKIDVLHNCTPNYLHFKINAEAIKRRIPIISEKPVGVNFEETATLVEIAEQYKVPNAVCFNYRFYPLIQQIREIIMAGELGEIYLVHGRYLQDWLLYAEDYNWRIDTRLGGKTSAHTGVIPCSFLLVRRLSGWSLTCKYSYPIDGDLSWEWNLLRLHGGTAEEEKKLRLKRKIMPVFYLK